MSSKHPLVTILRYTMCSPVQKYVTLSEELKNINQFKRKSYSWDCLQCR